MNAAKLYSKFNHLQQAINALILKEHMHFLNFKTNENLFEVGCGVGQSTTDLLRVLPHQNYNKFVATDISPNMISHAEKTNRNLRLQYFRMDITDENLPRNFVNSFDKVFSFKVMHWIDAGDQVKAFTNINKLLKKDGCIFISLVGDCPSFQVYREMYKNKKWGKYMKHSQEFCSPYNRSIQGTNEILLKVLSNSGFHVCFYENKERFYYYKSLEEFKNTIKALNPFLGRIPGHLHEDYWKDSFELYRKLSTVLETGEYGSDIIFLYAKKM